MKPLMVQETGWYMMVQQPNLPYLFHNSHSAQHVEGFEVDKDDLFFTIISYELQKKTQ